MKRLIPTSLAVAFVCGAALILTTGAANTPDEKAKAAAKKVEPYTLTAPLGVIMDVSDTIFYEMEDKLEAKKFRTLYKHSLFLAEIGNLMVRAKGEKEWETKEWKKFATDMREDLLKMAKASKAKKGPEVKALWTKVETSCEACHEKFRD
ncbi:MAG: cytochrome c [Planctomycetota bacterium]